MKYLLLWHFQKCDKNFVNIKLTGFGSYSAYNILEDEIYEQGKKLLEEPIDTSKDFEAHKKAKTHYKACMDDDKQNELGDVQITNHNQK